MWYREEIVKHLLTVSSARPSLIMEMTFPALMAALPDNAADYQEYRHDAVLDALAKLSVQRAMFEVLLTRLLNKLSVVITSRLPSTLLQSIHRYGEVFYKGWYAYYNHENANTVQMVSPQPTPTASSPPSSSSYAKSQPRNTPTSHFSTTASFPTSSPTPSPLS